MHNEFKTYKLNSTGIIHLENIAEKFDNLLSEIETLVDPSHELSIVKTFLEEACFYTKKAISKVSEFQADE